MVYPRGQQWCRSCLMPSFVIWMMGLSIPRGKFADKKKKQKTGRSDCWARGHAVTQRDLGRQKE